MLELSDRAQPKDSSSVSLGAEATVTIASSIFKSSAMLGVDFIICFVSHSEAASGEGFGENF